MKQVHRETASSAASSDASAVSSAGGFAKRSLHPDMKIQE
jgi:hypothetical protein